MQSYSIVDFNGEDVAKALNEEFNTLAATSRPADKPTAVLCGGQPGAGKTTIHEIQSTINPQIIIINGDEYRRHHPNYEKIQAKYGDDSVLHTQSFANAIVEGLIERLSSAKYPLVIEGTLRDPNVPLKTCATLKSKGYLVEMHVMAVSKHDSWQGTIDRYDAMKANGQTARATPKNKHDAVVDMLPQNISELHETKQFDRIALYTRTGACIYDSKDTPNRNPKEDLYNALHADGREADVKKN